MNKLIKLIKNKPILSAIIILLLLTAFTDIPLTDYLSKFIPYRSSLMISIFILQMSSFAFLLYLSHKLEISDEFNLNLSKPLRNLWLVLPFSLLIIANIIDDMQSSYTALNPLILFLYVCAFLSTGFFEEILFRGITFSLINNKLSSTKNHFYLSLFIANFLFGAAHITNLINGTIPLLNFINQLIYASIIGVMFTALYLRCNSLLIPIIIHGLIDVTGCTEFLEITSKELSIQARVQPPTDFQHIVHTLILFIPLLIWSLFLLRRSKISKDKIPNKIAI